MIVGYLNHEFSGCAFADLTVSPSSVQDMLYRQRLQTSLIISAICHLVLGLIVVKFQVTQPIELFANRINVDMFHFQPKRSEPPKTVRSLLLSLVPQAKRTEKKPEVSNPPISPSLDWTKVNQIEESQRLTAYVAQNESRSSAINKRILHGGMSHVDLVKSSHKEAPKEAPK